MLLVWSLWKYRWVEQRHTGRRRAKIWHEPSNSTERRSPSRLLDQGYDGHSYSEAHREGRSVMEHDDC